MRLLTTVILIVRVSADCGKLFFFPVMVEGALSSRLQADGAGLEGFVVRGNTTPQAVEFCRLDQRCREKECDA